jgi:hypothetical protein
MLTDRYDLFLSTTSAAARDMASMQPEFTAAFYLLEVAKRSLWLEELRETVQTSRPCCAKREASRFMIEMLIFQSGLASR